MKSFTYLLAIILTWLTHTALAADPQCHYGDKTLAIGEHISLIDPVLVREKEERMREEGKSETQIAHEIKYGDWHHIVMVCIRTFGKAVKADDQQAAGMIEANGAALIPINTQIEWVTKLKGYPRDNQSH